MDMPRYLDYLERRLVAAGGEIAQHRVATLAEAAEVAPVVVNCTGLGAKELVGDVTVTPVFGQHVIMTNPGLDELLLELGVESEWVSYFRIGIAWCVEGSGRPTGGTPCPTPS